jgi:predicted nucleic acid-binding protein
MFVLDTNVLSAIMAERPCPEVAAWIAGQPDDALFTTAISQAEILSGLAVMPDGRRRFALETAARAIFADDFDGRVLTFDTAAATAYADIFAVRRRAGRPTAPLDLMIAAVAFANSASVVTRDVSGFEGCGVAIIDPWTAS